MYRRLRTFSDSGPFALCLVWDGRSSLQLGASLQSTAWSLGGPSSWLPRQIPYLDDRAEAPRSLTIGFGYANPEHMVVVGHLTCSGGDAQPDPDNVMPPGGYWVAD
jgi:hypothetical protein